MTRFALAAVALALAAVAGVAQPPTAESVKPQFDKYKAERDEAGKTFSKEELVGADELAAKANEALKTENYVAAERLIRDARWQVPFVPAGLPDHVIRVLGVGRLRHGDRVNALSYSPDGTRLASASKDGTVRVWDIGNGRELLTYRGHEADKPDPMAKERPVTLSPVAVSYSSDGEWIASAGFTEIHVWDAKTGKKLHTLKGGHKAAMRTIAFGKDKTVLASGGDDKKVCLWDVPKEKVVASADEQAGVVNAVAFNSDGSLLAAVNGGGTATVYTPVETRLQLVYGGAVSQGRGGTNSAAFARGGTALLTGGQDAVLTLTGGIDGKGSGTTLRKFEGHSAAVNAVAASRDGKLFVSGSGDKSVVVWDAENGKQLRAFLGHPQDVIAVAIRPDGKQIASASEDGSIKLWPLTAADEHREMADAKDRVWAVAFSPDGKTAAAGGSDRNVRLYDAASGKLLKTLTGHKGSITTVAFIDNNTLLSTAGDKLAKVWDVAAGTATDLTGHGAAVLCGAASADGKLIVTGSADKTVIGWVGGKKAWTWTGKSAVCGVAVRKDGQRVAAGSADGQLTILNVTAAQPAVLAGVTVAPTGGIAAVTYSPDGERVATAGGDGAARVWLVRNDMTPAQQQVYTSPIKSGPNAQAPPLTGVAYSADGRFLVGGGAEGVARIWDAATGAEVRGLRGHGGWVTGVAFSPDGRIVLSGSVDKTARLFELPRAESAAVGHTLMARCVAVSRDGKLAATGSKDGTAKVWDLATGREVLTIPVVPSASVDDTGVTSVVFVGNNKLVCGSGDKTLKWYDLPGGKLTQTVQTNQVFSVAADPDGKKVGLAWASGSGDEAGFDVFAAGEATPTRIKIGKISAAALSPDAAWGVVGDEKGVIQIWDLVKKERIKGDWPILKDAVADIGVTPDRKTVVVIDGAGTVKVGDAEGRGEPLATVKALPAGADVKGVIVSPTGDKFATLASNGEIKAWDMKSKELRAWKLPYAAEAAVFTIDGKRLLTANSDGTSFVLELP